MDATKTGKLIRSLRLELGLTQKQLAERLIVSDQAVSKWERGLGCPDPSLITPLSDVLNVDVGSILSGDLDENAPLGGSMKNSLFYVCKTCEQWTVSTKAAVVSCCGRKMSALQPIKAEANDKLLVEIIENEYYIRSDHEMTKENHISFVAFVNGDTLLVRKLYPEWNLSTRIPRISRGTLYWYSKKDGLRFQYL